jgi:DNA polymerase III psi subunit
MKEPFAKLPRYATPRSHPSSTLGDDSQMVWVVLNQQEANDHDLSDLLRKILKAINIDLDSEVFQILVEKDESFYLANILPSNAKIIIAFGIPPSSLGMTIEVKLYNKFILRDHQFIFSDELSQIRNNGDNKRSLWSSLQSINIH